MEILALILGMAIGAAAGWLVASARGRVRAAGLEAELGQLRRVVEAREREAEELGARFQDAFKALAADALQSNSASFLDLARSALAEQQATARGELDTRRQAVEGLVAPLSKSLEKVDQRILELEKAREQAYGALREQVKQMETVQRQLRDETGNLVRALRAPAARGRWGEIQLRRVVEMAGMLDHVDFNEQESHTDDEGARRRPDMIVRLPGGKSVVVDAKTPLVSYIDAVEATDDDVRQAKLADHARLVHTHVTQLGAKSYWAQFDQTPEFVVMFLPGEDFFAAALRQDPGLIEEGVEQKVIIATPTTLIALLRAVAYGWQQEQVARSAREVSELGRDLYRRLRTLAGHLDGVGKGLDGAVARYNEAVGSLESRVLVAARRFSELGAGGGDELVAPRTVEKTTRVLQADGVGADAGRDDQDEADASV